LRRTSKASSPPALLRSAAWPRCRRWRTTRRRPDRTSSGSASWPKASACRSCPWARARTTRWPRRRARRSYEWAPCCGTTNISGGMGLGDLWNRTLVYFGIAEEYDDAWDEDGYLTEDDLEQTYAEPRANVRRLTPRGRRGEE